MDASVFAYKNQHKADVDAYDLQVLAYVFYHQVQRNSSILIDQLFLSVR